MAAEENKYQNKKPDKFDIATSKVSTNPELGIKKVRTFADDLKDAKEKAGVVEEPEEEKKSGFFNFKKKGKGRGIKTLGGVVSPTTAPSVPKKDSPALGEKKSLEGQKVPVAPKDAEQPSKDYIEKELARSGIIAENREEEVAEHEEESSVPIIRTLKYDAAESIEEGRMSRVTMAAAEQNRMARNNVFRLPDQDTTVGKNIVYLLISFVLVATGAWGGFYFYNKSNIQDEPAEQINKEIVLFTNSEKELSIGQLSASETMLLLDSEMKTTKESNASVKEIILTTSGLVGEKEIKAEDFLKKFGGAPGSLSRSLYNDFLFGIRGGSDPQPLLLFKTKDSETAFAGMLEWERTMSSDLSPVFGSIVGGGFEDVILKNKDTRMLRNSNGEAAIIYAFPNTETILITTNEDTFFDVFERLSVSNSKRD
jgi:hypothetical protein